MLNNIEDIQDLIRNNLNEDAEDCYTVSDFDDAIDYSYGEIQDILEKVEKGAIPTCQHCSKGKLELNTVSQVFTCDSCRREFKLVEVFYHNTNNIL